MRTATAGTKPTETGYYLECPECGELYTEQDVTRGEPCQQCGYPGRLEEVKVEVRSDHRGEQ